MYEVEVKLRIKSPIEPIIHFFEANNFSKKSFFVEDVYFKHPCEDFKATDKELRIRKYRSNGKVINLLTFKGPSANTSRTVREEIEFEVDEKIEIILKHLGFRPEITKWKKGYRFIKNNLDITLCEVGGKYLNKDVYLGFFMEIELLIDSLEGYNGALYRIRKLIEKIPGDFVEEKRYYTELIQEKAKIDLLPQ